MNDSSTRMNTSSAPLRPETIVVNSGRPHGIGEPLNQPIVMASTFVASTDARVASREYSRGDGTATWEAFETAIGELEGGHAVSFSSGMAAIHAVLSLLPTGAKIVAPNDLYQGVATLLSEGSDHAQWDVTRLATNDTPAWIAAAQSADLIWLETPSNPLLELGDIAQICQAARRSGAAIAVDNTFATPLLQRPLELGATFSVHSATKLIGGHSDLLSGVVVANTPSVADRVANRRLLQGATPGALESFLALRGLRTLAVRLERAQDTAMTLAQRLQEHPCVTLVRYPGLPSHPDYELAKKTLAGPGSMVSFELIGSAKSTDVRLSRLKLVRTATSLGGVETTVERRSKLAGQEHIPETLVRMSVGIEHVDDVWEDLDQALSGLVS